MHGSKAAILYARAVFAMAKEKGLAKEVNGDMVLITKTIEDSNDLRVFLKSPVIKDSIKKNALDEVFSQVNGITSGLFRILLENNRIQLLSLVASKYRDLYNHEMGVQIAKVTTAVPMTPELELKMREKVKRMTGHDAEIKNIVDKSIIGGFILRVGDLEYNGSVNHLLKDLGRQFSNNSYVSKI